MINDTPKINWVYDFGINEQLHSTAQAISAAYSLLSYNNPEHANHDKWRELGLEWFLYNKNIEKNFVFSSREQADTEVTRVIESYRLVSEIKESLKKKD